EADLNLILGDSSRRTCREDQRRDQRQEKLSPGHLSPPSMDFDAQPIFPRRWLKLAAMLAACRIACKRRSPMGGKSLCISHDAFGAPARPLQIVIRERRRTRTAAHGDSETLNGVVANTT